MKFSGMYSALVTPYTDDDRIDEDVLVALAERDFAAGVDGFYLCGSTSEGFLLGIEERRRIVELLVPKIQGRGKAFVHVGHTDVREACKLAKHAADSGADAVSSVPPVIFQADAEGMARYYGRIVDACGLPLIVYNIPALVGYPLKAGALTDVVAAAPTTCSVKFADYDLLAMREILEVHGDRINVLFGRDEMLLAGLVMGADGGIGGVYQCAPSLFVGIYREYLAGELAEAQRLQACASRMCSVFCTWNPLLAIREVLRLSGFAVGVSRLPLAPLTDDANARLAGLREREILPFL